MSFDRAAEVFPGVTQLLSKNPRSMAPGLWPYSYEYAEGFNIYDEDGKRWRDFSYNGIGACTLGYQDADVDRAVRRAVNRGVFTTLNCVEELTLAEKLLEIHTWADCVRFARTGGEAMAIAVRIARAATGQDHLAIGGYHGWHDWYVSANLEWDACEHCGEIYSIRLDAPRSGKLKITCLSCKGERSLESLDPLRNVLIPGLNAKGVPRGLAGTARVFHHNNIEELNAITSSNGQLAATVFEIQRHEAPTPEFLLALKRAGKTSVLICDEITSGFRLCNGGAHLHYGFEPDIAVFGKALGNGYAISAVIGKREVMEAAKSTFISSTMWTERVGPSAAIATINKFGQLKAHEKLSTYGLYWQGMMQIAAHKFGLDANIGHPDMPALSYCYPKAETDLEQRELKTLMTQEYLKRGYLFGGDFYVTVNHTREAIDVFKEATYEVLPIVAGAQRDGNAAELLEGPCCESRFERLTR